MPDKPHMSHKAGLSMLYHNRWDQKEKSGKAKAAIVRMKGPATASLSSWQFPAYVRVAVQAIKRQGPELMDVSKVLIEVGAAA